MGVFVDPPEYGFAGISQPRRKLISQQPEQAKNNVTGTGRDRQNLTYKKPYDSADGHRDNIYLTGIFGLTPQTSLFVGVDGTRVSTQVRSDDYYQTGLRGGLFTSLTPDTNLLVMTTQRHTRFGEYNVLTGDERRDREQMYMARLSAPGWKLLTFSPFISYRYRINHSSSDGLYSFRQHEIITGIETNF